MLIIALVLAVIGLAALVTAVVTSNELIAWVCIGASVIGVVLLIVDALRERSQGGEEAVADGSDPRDHPHDEETTVLPAESASGDPALDEHPGGHGAAEDYPEEEPAEGTDVRTSHLAPHEQSVDPATDDLPSARRD